MARVPTTAGGFVDRRGGGMPAFQAPDATAGFREIGEATRRLGGALAQQAEVDEALDRDRDEAAAKMIDTEYSDWSRQELFEKEGAFYTLEGFAADNARGDLESAIDKKRDDYLARASNPRQQRLIEEALARRMGADKQGIATYSSNQYRIEEKRQGEARLGAARNDALTYWEDPTRFGEELLVGEAEIRSAGAKAGQAKETTDLAVEKWRSDVYGSVGANLIRGGRIDDAIAWADQARPFLSPDDEAALDAALYRPILERKVDGLADYIMGLTPAPTTSATPSAPASGGRVTGSMMYNITAVSESGNRERDARGRLITSAAGAKGKMQVMPGTERDPGFGVKPMQDNSDAERTRVGRDYLDAMLKRYGGDPAKAWGAYNWGPGAVDGAIKKYGDNWLDHAPAETQAYVAKNMAALGRPMRAGSPEASAQRHDLGDLLAKVDAMGLPFEEEKALKQEIERRVQTDESLRRREQDDAAERANEILDRAEASGAPITKESQIPPEVWNAMDPSARLTLRGVIARNAKPADRVTDPGRYTELSDLYATNPDAFAKIDPMSYRNKLSDSDYQQVLGWRRDALNGDKASEKQVGLSRIKSITSQIRAINGLTTAGIPTGQVQKRQQMEQRIYDVEQAVVRDVEIWQRANPGKIVPDDVILQSARRQLTETRNKDEGRANPQDRRFWFERDRGVGQYTVAIPTKDYNRIRAAGRKVLGRDPTPAEISEVWQREGRGGN